MEPNNAKTIKLNWMWSLFRIFVFVNDRQVHTCRWSQSQSLLISQSSTWVNHWFSCTIQSTIQSKALYLIDFGRKTCFLRVFDVTRHPRSRNALLRTSDVISVTGHLDSCNSFTVTRHSGSFDGAILTRHLRSRNSLLRLMRWRHRDASLGVIRRRHRDAPLRVS
jgi:hypothetical protein